MTEIISRFISYSLYLSIPTVLCAGFLYHFLPYNSQQSKWCFSGLMLVFAAALLKVSLVREGWMLQHPVAYFFPIWYTLSFGVLLFYAVKTRLYPAYRLRGSDIKHFILPALQAFFFIGIYFLVARSVKLNLLQDFIPTYYKPVEGAFFIVLFFSYLALAFRYIKYKQAVLRKRGFEQGAQRLERLRRMVKVLFFLGGINTSYILSDFFAWQFLGLNLYTVKGFASLNDLSFAAMGLWLGWFAWCEYRSPASKNKENTIKPA